MSVRLYVFDCGTLERSDVGRYRLKPEEVVTSRMSVACYLVAHPKGALMWDVGAAQDAEWKATGKPVDHHVVLPTKEERFLTLRKALLPQLAEAGFSSADVTHLAMSHYHWDHTANANAFAGATWLVRPVEHDAMLSEKSAARTQPAGYSKLRGSKTVLIKADDHDVFGDGAVVIKAAYGHTPGHQVLYVRLARTGPVVLSGDLYHYPEERSLKRLPTFDINEQQTAASREALEAFLKKSGAQLWIQHDFTADAKLKKSPDYYE
jgi:glyoxylase-like metal-dependent hydrolase (beta-lactamase superfamily II)